MHHYLVSNHTLKMNSQPPKLRSQRSLTSELPYSIPLCLLAAHAFVSFRQSENLVDVIYKSGYPLAFSASFLIAFSLILIVKYTTSYLDRKEPWHVHKNRRIVLQFFYGFCLAFVFEWAMSSAYFLGNGYTLQQTIWADSYALPIGMYILMINAYYNPLTQMHPTEELVTKPVQPIESIEHMDELELIEEVQANEHSEHIDETEIIEPVKASKSINKTDPAITLSRAIEYDVVFIATSNKKVYARNRKGEHVLWHDTLANSIAALPAQDFFPVNRSCILHRDIIDELLPDPESHKLTVTLKAPFKDKIDVPNHWIYDFEVWFHKKSV